MESKLTLTNNCWIVIIDYLDINTLFQFELINKYYQSVLYYYYESKEVSNMNKPPSNQISTSNKNKNYKRLFLSKYFNMIMQSSITNPYCYTEEMEKNEGVLPLKIKYENIVNMIFGKTIQYLQMEVYEKDLSILYRDNSFKILELNEETKEVKLIFQQNLTFAYFIAFCYVPRYQCYIFLDDNSNFYTFTKESDEFIKIKHMFTFPPKTHIINIYNIKDYLLFLDDNDNFYYIIDENFPFPPKEDNKDKEEMQENSIYQEIKPISFERNYTTILSISASKSSLMFVDESYRLFYITGNEISKMETTTIKFRTNKDMKFPNYYTMFAGDSHFLLLEKEIVPPLMNWTTEEVYKWFEEMKLDDYLNIIKYEKITGKDIYNADSTFFENVMGMEEDQMKKVKYEVTKIKQGYGRNTTMWGWGSNKKGQLGVLNYSSAYIKTPTKLKIPELSQEMDSIEKVYCGKTFSLLLTKFGNIYITGNYVLKDMEDKYNASKTKDDNTNVNVIGNRNKKQNKDIKKMKKDNVKKTIELKHDRWIDITKDLCFNSISENYSHFLKVKNIIIYQDNVFFFGYKSDIVPFGMVVKKAKFKHTKKGDKFTTPDQLIEYMLDKQKDKVKNLSVVYNDACLKLLEDPVLAFMESEVPYHRIEQLKYFGEIIWDRKKRYIKPEFDYDILHK